MTSNWSACILAGGPQASCLRSATKTLRAGCARPARRMRALRSGTDNALIGKRRRWL